MRIDPPAIGGGGQYLEGEFAALAKVRLDESGSPSAKQA
jgi:hypothetical protein